MLGGLHHTAMARTVYTVTIVHVVDLRVMCESCPDCSGGHAFVYRRPGASAKGPHHTVGEWLCGLLMMKHADDEAIPEQQ